MRRAAALAGALAMAALPLAGCAARGTAQASDPVTVPSGLTPAPSGVPEQYDDGTTGKPLPASTLTLDRASRLSALEIGRQVMVLFARRDVSAQVWYDDLQPLLTPDAAVAYQHVDPLNVPPTKVTGPAKLTPASTGQVGRVSVPTNAGVYLVILARTDEDPRWLADRIIPPEGPGDS